MEGMGLGEVMESVCFTLGNLHLIRGLQQSHEWWRQIRLKDHRQALGAKCAFTACRITTIRALVAVPEGQSRTLREKVRFSI